MRSLIPAGTRLSKRRVLSNSVTILSGIHMAFLFNCWSRVANMELQHSIFSRHKIMMVPKVNCPSRGSWCARSICHIKHQRMPWLFAAGGRKVSCIVCYKINGAETIMKCVLFHCQKHPYQKLPKAITSCHYMSPS